MAEEKKKETLTLGTLSIGSTGDSGKRKGVAVEVKKNGPLKKVPMDSCTPKVMRQKQQ